MGRGPAAGENYRGLLAMLVLSLCVVLSLPSCRRQSEDVQDPDSRIASAWMEFRMGEYKKAIEIFGDISENSKIDKDGRTRALYGLACTHWQKLPDADKPLAKKFFGRIIEESPDSEYAGWSELALIRMDHIVPSGEKPDYPSLRARYKELYEKFPTSTPGHEGFIYMVTTLISTLDQKDASEALASLDAFLGRHPDSPFISSVWSLRAKACEILEKPGEMLDAMMKALDTIELDPSNPSMNNADRYWQIATVAEYEAGNFAVAERYYRKFVEEYPQERRKFAAMRELEKIRKLRKQFDGEAAK